jgi:hypothetical protein
MLLAALAVCLYAVALPLYVGRLQEPCVGPACLLGQLPSQSLAAQARLGVTPAIYSGLYTAFNVFVTAVSFAIAGIIFLRRPGDAAAWTTSLLLVTLPIGNVIALLPGAQHAWRLPVQFMGWVTAVDLALAFYTFPDGRFVPGWTRPLALIWAILMALENFVPAIAARMAQSAFFGVLGSLFIASLAIAQVVRYRRASNTVQRQQTKWVVVGTVLALGLFLAYNIPSQTIPALRAPGSLYPAARLLVDNGFVLVVAASIGVAILRHRLWDIDLIINRALVYGSLTLALTLVYLGAVVILQGFLGLVTGAESPLATVAATLLLAALFRPLRARIQSAIDRRFYRRKYDAAHVVAAFGALLRDDEYADLDRASAALVSVVADTFEPRHVWLWLPKPTAGNNP